MEKKEKILMIITGGTIDSFYDGTKDTVVPLKRSAIPDYIKSLKFKEPIMFNQVCMKDSRSLTGEDLKKILSSINRSSSKRIIITHGTYTMPDTARFLSFNLKRKDQTIILTGSMMPLTGFSPSDAPFNLGYSLSAINSLKHGIYVCMNGQIFSSGEVAKEISKGKFVSVFDK